MALKPKIYKLRITHSDVDRNYYDTLNLTIARHLSETLERMMVRVLPFLFSCTGTTGVHKGALRDERTRYMGPYPIAARYREVIYGQPINSTLMTLPPFNCHAGIESGHAKVGLSTNMSPEFGCELFDVRVPAVIVIVFIL